MLKITSRILRLNWHRSLFFVVWRLPVGGWIWWMCLISTLCIGAKFSGKLCIASWSEKENFNVGILILTTIQGWKKRMLMLSRVNVECWRIVLALWTGLCSVYSVHATIRSKTQVKTDTSGNAHWSIRQSPVQMVRHFIHLRRWKEGGMNGHFVCSIPYRNNYSMHAGWTERSISFTQTVDTTTEQLLMCRSKVLT